MKIHEVSIFHKKMDLLFSEQMINLFEKQREQLAILKSMASRDQKGAFAASRASWGAFLIVLSFGIKSSDKDLFIFDEYHSFRQFFRRSFPLN